VISSSPVESSSMKTDDQNTRLNPTDATLDPALVVVRLLHLVDG
jgi:hypothetical protein